MKEMSDERNGWNEYSKLVLKELETLARGISDLSYQLHEVKRELALIKDREDKVEELKIWKDKIAEVVSPSQLAIMVTEVKELKEFKTRAITIFAVIQFIMLCISIFGKYIWG